MPTLTLTPPGGGSPVSVSVDDSFSQLSPADQEQTVNEISSQVFKSTSPLTALRNSTGSIVSGLGAADKTIGQLAGKYAGGTMVGNGLQTWADTAGNVLNDAGQAISGDRQYDGQSIHRLGTDLSQGNLGGAAYDAAGAIASAAPYAATAALGPGGVAALAASGAGNTVQSREAAQGEQAPSGGDLLAGGASAALNALGGPLAHGVMGGIAGRLAAPEIASMASPVARAAARVALGAGAGGAMGAGNYALDNAGTGQGNLSGMANAAIEGAGTGAIASPVAQGAGMGVKALQDARTAAQAGPDVQAYQKETAPWTAAVQQAAQTIKAANPNLDDDTVQQAAQAQANQQGLAAPTYDQLSPQAQNGMAKMGLLNLYNQRLQASTTNMGRDTAEPAAVFKGVMDDLSGNIKQIGQGLADAGQISKDQIAPLNAAVAEAVRNNRVSAQGGADLGYFDTTRDQVANLPIDQSTKNTLLLNLNMLDLAQQNSMKGAAQGPLERNAGTLSTLGGAAAAAALGASGHGGSLGGLGLEELGIGGGLLGHYKGAVVRSGLRQLDQMMGTQLPPLLRNQQAIQDYAAQNNLQPGGAPGDLMALQAQLQQQAADNQAQAQAAQAAQAPQPLTPVQAGQQQAAKTLAATLGRYGDQHPLGMQAMQSLNDMGQQPMIAQALARYNGLGGLRGVQDQMAQQQANQAAQTAIARMQALQAAKGNAQAVKDQGFLSGLQNRQAKSNAMAVWQPQGTGGNSGAQSVPLATSTDLLRTVLNNQAAQRQTQAQALSDGLRTALPVLGTGWQNAISKQTGLPVSFIQDHLQGLVDNGNMAPNIHAAINQQDTLEAGDYHRLNSYFHQLAGSPDLPTDVPGMGLPSASTPDQSGVRNKQSYGANLAQHGAIVADVRSRYPDLADKANMLATIKTQQARQQALAGWVDAETDPAEQARLEEALGPLTQFGWKPSSGTPNPDMMASVAARTAYRASQNAGGFSGQ